MRNKGLDLIKLLAIITMVIDHSRFILTSHALLLTTIGRWAFIFFAVSLAYNCHTAISQSKLSTLKSYFKNLTLFALISEIPYRLMVESDGLNIMFTLLLGVFAICIYAYLSKPLLKLFGLTCLFALVFLANDYLDYGVLGVSLIFISYLIAEADMEFKILLFPIFLLIALASSLQAYAIPIEVLGLVNSYTLPIILSITSACIFYFIILYIRPIEFNVPKVGKWAYWFYPVHMLAIAAIIQVMTLFT